MDDSVIKMIGDSNSFDNNWRQTDEAHYLHWTKGEPRNQVQLAFRNHWKTFSKLIRDHGQKKVLEVGCGRGSLSAYFAEAGWECTLLDISQSALDLAKKAFGEHGLKGEFIKGDCQDLPIGDSVFDLVFSIGLFEHFQDFGRVIKEQYRVLRKGGMCIGYVVPEMKNNVQSEYNWICEILKVYSKRSGKDGKSDVYRSDIMSGPYLACMQDIGFHEICSSGIYPLPMVSHSIEFPFTLMEQEAEEILVAHLNEILERRIREGKDPWLCEENEGQAFIIWAVK